jgi:hypothetical protein
VGCRSSKCKGVQSAASDGWLDRKPLKDKLPIGVFVGLLLCGSSIVFWLLIELVLALLPTEGVLLALVRTRRRGLVFVYLLATNRIFGHD